LVRNGFLESRGRHSRLFKPHPPSLVLQFVERVPMVKGRCDPRLPQRPAMPGLSGSQMQLSE
jgi:hypothetical protein